MTAQTGEWSPGEMQRGIERLEVSLEGLRQELREQNVVHADVYLANREADHARMDDIEKDVDALGGTVRNAYRVALTGLLLPLTVMLVGAAVLAVLRL